MDRAYHSDIARPELMSSESVWTPQGLDLNIGCFDQSPNQSLTYATLQTVRPPQAHTGQASPASSLNDYPRTRRSERVTRSTTALNRVTKPEVRKPEKGDNSINGQSAWLKIERSWVQILVIGPLSPLWEWTPHIVPSSFRNNVSQAQEVW